MAVMCNVLPEECKWHRLIFCKLSWKRERERERERERRDLDNKIKFPKEMSLRMRNS